MSDAINIRLATAADANALREIYLPYVRETAVTFELEDPSIADFAQRVERITAGYPYLMAEQDGAVLGFCYASAFRPRAAYLHAAETSIYVRRDYKGHGLGTRLYETMAKLLLLQNVYNMEACIAHIDPADEYVPATSRCFHERRGFTLAATHRKCAYKFGRWYDMIWMERILREHPANPEPFVPFPAVDRDLVADILAQA